MTKKKKILLTVTGILLAFMAAAYIAAALFFRGHFYSGTMVNGIDSTYLGAEAVKKQVADSIQEYTLTIKKKDNTIETVTAKQLQIAFEDDKEVDKLLKRQEPWLWIVEIFKNKVHDLKVSVNLSDEALASTVDGLDCMQEANVTPPGDAVIEETDTGFTITPETEGNQLNRDLVIEAVKDAVLSGKKELDLEQSGCYLKPSVYQDDDALNNRLNHLNQLISANLTMNFGSGRTETVDAGLLKTWIIQDESGTDSIDSNKAAAYVAELANRYNTAGSSRTFTKTGGGTVKLTAGDYGWVMDTDTTLANLMSAIDSGTQGDFKVSYTNSAKSRESNDIGNSYVEISIDQQTMWCYVDGKLLVSTPIVTGDISKGHDTPRGGVWKVKGRRTDYTMTGKIDPATGKPSYTAHCNYWIPYSEDLTIGIHDLVSRAAYGGNIYLTNGSHGCINTPLEAVKQIYDVVAYGFPVVVY